MSRRDRLGDVHRPLAAFLGAGTLFRREPWTWGRTRRLQSALLPDPLLWRRDPPGIPAEAGANFLTLQGNEPLLGTISCGRFAAAVRS